jgi:hypothetical protein
LVANGHTPEYGDTMPVSSLDNSVGVRKSVTAVAKAARFT